MKKEVKIKGTWREWKSPDKKRLTLEEANRIFDLKQWGRLRSTIVTAMVVETS